jgi:membrane protease YdiL (CAAX protease family)
MIVQSLFSRPPSVESVNMTDPWLLMAPERLTASLGVGPAKGQRLDMRPFWVFVPLFLGVFAVSEICGLVFANHVPAGTSYWLDTLLGVVVLAAGCFVLHHEYRPSLAQLGLQRDLFRSPSVRRWIYLAIAVAVGLKTVPLLISQVRWDTTSNGLHPLVQETWAHLPSYLILDVVLVPLVEEFTFRGYIYLVLRQNWGDTIAAIVPSAIFAVAHGSHALFNFWLALLWIYFNNRAGSLWPSIGAHVVLNAGLLIFPPLSTW